MTADELYQFLKGRVKYGDQTVFLPGYIQEEYPEVSDEIAEEVAASKDEECGEI